MRLLEELENRVAVVDVAERAAAADEPIDRGAERAGQQRRGAGPPQLQGPLLGQPGADHDRDPGPGAGTFYALGFVRYCHYDLLGATARAKALNLLSNVAALATFVAAGRVDWRVGLPMAGLSVAGNWVGAHLGVRGGAAVIRPVVLLVCAGLFAKLLFDAVL